MVGRTEALAKEFEEANRALIETVERLTPEEWVMSCGDDERSVGVVAHHVAVSHPELAGLVQMVAAGQPLPPIDMTIIDQGNAEHAEQNTGCTREETLALLRSGGEQAAHMLRGLSDEGLDRTATLLGNQVTAEEMIWNVLINHPREHLRTVRAAMEGKRNAAR